MSMLKELRCFFGPIPLASSKCGLWMAPAARSTSPPGATDTLDFAPVAFMGAPGCMHDTALPQHCKQTARNPLLYSITVTVRSSSMNENLNFCVQNELYSTWHIQKGAHKNALNLYSHSSGRAIALLESKLGDLSADDDLEIRSLHNWFQKLPVPVSTSPTLCNGYLKLPEALL